MQPSVCVSAYANKVVTKTALTAARQRTDHAQFIDVTFRLNLQQQLAVNEQHKCLFLR